ncbi:MAG: (2Fe-2S)-binding protein [Bacteriovoracaceae bacterium]
MLTKTFQEHFHHPENSGKPSFFQSKIEYSEKNLKVTAFLDVNQKEKIEQFKYVYEGTPTFLPYLSALGEIVRGMSLEIARTLSSEDFKSYFEKDTEYQNLEAEGATPWCNLAIVILSKLIEDYEGTFVTTTAHMKGQKEDDLLCRCFGIYQSELKNLLIENRHFEIQDLTAKTKAGAGCRSCIVDIDELYFLVREDYPLRKQVNEVKVASSYKIQDRTTAQWVLELDKGLKSFLQMNGLEMNMLEIEKFKFPELRLKVVGAPEKLSLEKLEAKILYHLEQSTGLKLTLVWKY